jgi:hypothetical protein
LGLGLQCFWEVFGIPKTSQKHCNPNPNPNPNDITHLSQFDVAAMAQVLAVSICNHMTVFLHAVHLSLMKLIFGQYGPKEGLYDRLQDQWDDLPMNSNRQLIHYLHSEDGGLV